MNKKIDRNQILWNKIALTTLADEYEFTNGKFYEKDSLEEISFYVLDRVVEDFFNDFKYSAQTKIID